VKRTARWVLGEARRRPDRARVSSSHLGGCNVRCTCNWSRMGRLACYPTPGTLWWRLSCYLSSQECQPLVVPLGLCNLLRKKPSEKVMPPGTGFAFSCSRQARGRDRAGAVATWFFREFGRLYVMEFLIRDLWIVPQTSNVATALSRAPEKHDTRGGWWHSAWPTWPTPGAKPPCP
jgi:hypothetical protein